MSEVFNSSLEVDFTGWTVVATGSGTVVHTTPGLAGSAGCAEVTFDSSTTAAYLTRTVPAMTTQTDLRLRKYVDIEALIMGSGNGFYAMGWFGGSTPYAGWQFRGVGSVLSIRHFRRDDALAQASEDIPVSVIQPAWVEIWVTKSSADTVTDAVSRMYFGGGGYDPAGELVSTLSGFELFTAFTTPTTVRVGCSPISIPGTSGIIRSDEAVMRDDAIPIGPVTGPASAVLEVPGDQEGKYGVAEVLTPITITPGDGTVDDVDLTCASGCALTVVQSGSASITGNGTNAVNVTGSETDILATVETVSAARSDPGDDVWFTNDVVTITVQDDQAQTAIATINLQWSPSAGAGTRNIRLTGTSADILATIAEIGWTPDTAGAATLFMKSLTDGLADEDEFAFTVEAAGGSGGGGLGSLNARMDLSLSLRV